MREIRPYDNKWILLYIYGFYRKQPLYAVELYSGQALPMIALSHGVILKCTSATPMKTNCKKEVVPNIDQIYTSNEMHFNSRTHYSDLMYDITAAKPFKPLFETMQDTHIYLLTNQSI